MPVKRKNLRRKKRMRKPILSKPGRLNLVIHPGLKESIHDYAKRHHTTVTQLVIDHFVELLELEKTIDVEQI